MSYHARAAPDRLPTAAIQNSLRVLRTVASAVQNSEKQACIGAHGLDLKVAHFNIAHMADEEPARTQLAEHGGGRSTRLTQPVSISGNRDCQASLPAARGSRERQQPAMKAAMKAS